MGIGDLDGDGKAEILSTDPICDGSNSLGATYWREDDGVGRWTEHTVDDSFYGAYRVGAADVDGNGDNDVIAAAYYGVIWPPMPGGHPCACGQELCSSQRVGECYYGLDVSAFKR